VKFGHLTTSGVLAGDAVQLLDGVLESVIRSLEGRRLVCITHATSWHLRPWPLGVTAVSPLIPMFALAWVLRMALTLRAHVPLVSLSASLGFVTLARCHNEAWGEKSVGGGRVILAMEGSMLVLCQPALA
jgi:hypothetical protein